MPERLPAWGIILRPEPFAPMNQRFIRRRDQITVFVAAFAAMLFAIVSTHPKALNHFDQSFYLTIAYDLDRHGVFSGGKFDQTDSTVERPAPGMFFGPVYPVLVLAAMRADARFAAAVECSVEADHDKRRGENCEAYALPMHIVHALFLAFGVLAIGLTGEAMFGGRAMFWLAALVALASLVPHRDLFSFVMTEAVSFGLYAALGLAAVLGWKSMRPGMIATAGLLLGVLCLHRPNFLLLLLVVPALTVLAGYLAGRDSRWRGWLGALAVIAGFVAVVGPWVVRNHVVIGKTALTEEYGAAAIIERFAYNGMTGREFAAAFPYCIPEIGPPIARGLFGSAATDRFEWNFPQSFFYEGRARRDRLVVQHGRLDSLIPGIIADELKRDWPWQITTSIPLAWCGMQVAGFWSVVLVPVFLVACILALRRRQPLFLLYAAPALVMVALHAGVANHYVRYNLGLIGPFAVGAAWLAIQSFAAMQTRRKARTV